MRGPGTGRLPGVRAGAETPAGRRAGTSGRAGRTIPPAASPRVQDLVAGYPHGMGEDLSAAAAKGWAVRWELQREQREAGREERFTVVGDLVELITAGRDRPAVLDLGCGTGSLAARLKRRMPSLDVVAADADPVLLGLGRRMHGTRVRFVDTVIGGIGWQDELELDRPLDAAVSATMLHRLPERVLLEVYGRLHTLLRPGGLLVSSRGCPRRTRPSPSWRARSAAGWPSGGGCRAARTGPHGGTRRPRRPSWPGSSPSGAAAARPPRGTTG